MAPINQTMQVADNRQLTARISSMTRNTSEIILILFVIYRQQNVNLCSIQTTKNDFQFGSHENGEN